MSAESTGPSVLQLLLNDHKRIRGLLHQVEVLLEGRPHEMLPAVAAEAWAELEIHSRIERELVYPALLNLPPGSGDYALAWDRMEKIREGVMKGQQKHDELDRRVWRIRNLSTSAEDYMTPFTELRDDLLLHLKEEEEKLFPLIDGMSPALEPLAHRVEARRKELLAEPIYKEASPILAQNPNGGEQKRRVSTR